MYARKSGFCTKKVKQRSKKGLISCAKVCKNGLKVGKTRKNTNTRLIRSRSAHKAPHTHKHKKATPVRIE